MVMKQLSDNEFEELLSKYGYSFQIGDIVKGTVCAYDSEGALVDIGAKTNAICPMREAKINREDNIEEILKKGETYDFLIYQEEENERFCISHKKVALAQSWKELEEIKKTDAIIEGTIVNTVKGGVLVEVLGVRGFVPTSHLYQKDGRNPEVGEKIELKILNLDMAQNNFILSSRKAHSDNLEDIKKDIFSQLEIGQVVKGEVVRLADFGAFIDIGGVDGLLPLSQISWKWVDHPQDVLTVGEKIDVEIIGIDFDKNRVSLSLKNLEADPWVEAQGKINEGEKIKGKITRMKHFGAFVEVYPCVEALLPQNEVIQYQNTHNCVLGIGDIIEITILKFNSEDKRISLTVNDDEV